MNPPQPIQTHLPLRLAEWFIALCVPILLVIGSVRVVMSPQFLAWNYQRPDFPADYYGFSTDDRLRYGPLGIEYILNSENITFLAAQRLPLALCYQAPANATDCPMFNASELKHMEDVKLVAQGAFAVGALLLGLSGVINFWLWSVPNGKKSIKKGLISGVVLTFGAIITIITMALAAWDAFFELFHNLFFTAGTWRFFYSDTLIRLYPEAFWFTAAVVVGTITILGAISLFIIAWRWQK